MKKEEILLIIAIFAPVLPFVLVATLMIAIFAIILAILGSTTYRDWLDNTFSACRSLRRKKAYHRA